MRPIDAVSFVRNIIHYHAFFVVFIFIFFFSFLYMSFRLFLYFLLICLFFRAVWFENLMLQTDLQTHRRTERHFTGGGRLRRNFALKITICPKNKQFALKLTFLV